MNGYVGAELRIGISHHGKPSVIHFFTSIKSRQLKLALGYVWHSLWHLFGSFFSIGQRFILFVTEYLIY